MLNKWALIASALSGALVTYLLSWPTGVEPVAWTPPPAPKLEGQYALNDKLKGIERLAQDAGKGPEGIFVDARGRIYGGYTDGRVVRLSADGQQLTELFNTGGRPLGITVAPGGEGIVIADAKKGLLLHDGNASAVLALAADGVPFGFTDDADTARESPKVYFSDASYKFGYGQHMRDLLEHGPNGRLLEYDASTQETRTLVSGLQFANGVAVGPGDAWVLVNETGKYRVLRYWLKGEKAGTLEVFIDNLPGFPDNITWNGRDRFWLAIFAPRDALLDEMLPGNLYLRKVVARLPAALQPKPRMHAFVLGLDHDGKVVANLQYAGPDAYAPITSAREFGGHLYFGSLTYPAIGRIKLDSVETPVQP
jgi:sugar lactone lactonase YvrE